MLLLSTKCRAGILSIEERDDTTEIVFQIRDV